MKTKEKIYLAKMDFDNGNSAFLKITMDENDVNAWHCRILPKNDYRILEIKPSENE